MEAETNMVIIMMLMVMMMILEEVIIFCDDIGDYNYQNGY